jgi:hypothetical protein
MNDASMSEAAAGSRSRRRRQNGDSKSSVTAVLRRFGERWEGERVSLGDIVGAMRQRGHGMMMLIFALPAMLPINLPGVAAIFGIPAGFVALQLLLRREHVWLPRALRERSVTREDFQSVISRSLPYVERIERLLKPRLTVLTETLGECLIGLTVLVLSLLLALPIPFTNIPLGFSIALLSLGLIERDGLVVLIGTLVAMATGAFVFAVGWEATLEVVSLVTGR